MNDITFREATLDDLPAIVALLVDDDLGRTREASAGELSPAYVAAFEAIDASPDQFQAVAVDENKVVGCLQISYLPGLSFQGMWRGQIESVRIARDLRGKGHGRKFLAWAIEQCRGRGCGMVQLNTHKSRQDALRFYESLGFTPSHEGLKLMLR